MTSAHIRRLRAATFLFLSLVAGLAAAAPSTPGNVVVYRVGDGSVSPAGAATAVFLDEYRPNGTLAQSIALPTAVSGSNRRITASSTAGSDGLLNRSVDGRYLLATGYDAAPGTASITGTASATTARVVGRVYADGTIDSTTALADAASATNFRSAASLDGASFRVTGGTGTAVRYAALGATSSTQLFTTPSNFRFVNIAGGQLYVSSGTGTRLMAAVGSGTPTTAGQSAVNLPGLPTSASVYNQFVFADLNPGAAGVDTLYIADENPLVGIIKYSLIGSTWVSNGSIGGGSYAGLAGVVSSGSVVLYGTRNGTDLVTITDASGHNGAFAGVATVIRSATANTAFRGLALAPQAWVTVTPSAGLNGTISPGTPQSVLLGTTTSFTVTPDPGYTAVVGGTCGGTQVANVYTTNVLLGSCTVSVAFTAIPTFTVTPSAGAGGSISPNAPQVVVSGNSKVFTVTPSTGYTASVGGTCGGSLVGNTYTTDAIAADCTVEATFALITYTVTGSAGANGSISPVAPQTIGYGASAVFNVTPNAGFGASVGGTCGGTLNGATYTTNAVAANCTVVASFAPLPRYVVSPTAGPNGNVSPATPIEVISGQSASFSVVPAPGYNAAVRGTCGGSFSGDTYVTRPVTGPCSISVVFARKLVLFVGNSYTFGRIDPVMSYNTGAVTDLTYDMWIANPIGSNIDEPHPWGGIPGVFKKMTDQRALDYDVSISARNAASLRGHYLNSNPAGWDLRGNIASQRWDAVVLQDLSDEPLPAGRGANANLPYFDAYVDKIVSWIHVGAAESYTESQLFGGTTASCRAQTGASANACNTLRTIGPANGNARSGTDVFLYQTWARPDMIAPNGTNANGPFYTAAEGIEAMTADLRNAYVGRAEANPGIADVSLVGDAFLRAVTDGVAMRDPYVPEPGKVNLWHTDYFHPSKYGSYLSAAVHFATITGINPLVLGPSDQAAVDLGIAPDIAMKLQRVAQAVVDPDTTPPVTTVTVSEPPNANGWNRGDVTIGFSAVDEGGGSMIDAIRYAAEGAQPGSGSFGASGSLAISAEGVTTVTYYAVDRAGNAEAPRTIRVAIDRTPPAITGMPGAACSLWPPNNKMVAVSTVSAAGGTSGLASFSVGATSNEAPTKPNESDTLVLGAGFGPRTVMLRASRDGGGSGRVYTVTASASDAAGNSTSVSATCVVPHNQ